MRIAINHVCVGWACPAVLVVVAVIGCDTGPGSKRLNAPYFAEGNPSPKIASYFTSMVDNGLLSTMSISDFHFVPNTTELNSAGVERLRRYARLLKPYGGTLHYQSDEVDAAIIETKVAHIRDVLAATGLDVDGIRVEAGRSRGKGITAVEAIKIKNNGESTEDSGSRSDAGGLMGLLSGGSGG